MHKLFLIIFLGFWYSIISFCSASEEISWVDLPEDDLSDILYKYDSKLDKLNRLIQEYHRIEKISWKKIQDRLASLENIECYANKLAESFSEKPFKEKSEARLRTNYLKKSILNIANIALRKKNYLKEIKNLKEFKLKELEETLCKSNEIPAPYTPLILTNKRRFNNHLGATTGHYFIEAVDPCHRRTLITYYMNWTKKYPQGELPDFFLWLEDKNVSPLSPCIQLATQEDLKKHKIIIKNGKFYSSEGTPLTINSKETELDDEDVGFRRKPIFIIDEKEQIYLGYNGPYFCHVSLSHYKPIIGSGALWLKDGEIQQISLSSGHYRPQEIHNIQVFKFLEQKGIKMKDSIKLKFHIGYCEIVTTVGEFRKYYLNGI